MENPRFHVLGLPVTHPQYQPPTDVVPPGVAAPGGQDFNLNGTTITAQTQVVSEIHPDLVTNKNFNIGQPLPYSQYVKSLRTGEVMGWSESFARQPDEFTNCDVNGNTSPDAWSIIAEPEPDDMPLNQPPPGLSAGAKPLTLVLGRPLTASPDDIGQNFVAGLPPVIAEPFDLVPIDEA
jgi:hypothetical protein